MLHFLVMGLLIEINEKSGGGIRIYIRDTIEFKVDSNISKLDDSIERLWVEIHERKILHV